MTGAPVRVVFCGDRALAVRIVEFVNSDGGSVVGLGVNPPSFSTHWRALRDAAGVDAGMVFYGRSLSSAAAVRKLADASPDLGVCCGFTSILSPELLGVPRWGWVNIHRSYLPYNRGLDPLQWALVSGTPAGVTLHVMEDRVDAGPILAQEEIPVLPTDTGLSLAEKADGRAFELFRRTWPDLREGRVEGRPQDEDLASYHTTADCRRLRRLDLGSTTSVRRLLDTLRAYADESGPSTSGVFFEVGLMRYWVSARISATPVQTQSKAEKRGERSTPGDPADGQPPRR